MYMIRGRLVLPAQEGGFLVRGMMIVSGLTNWESSDQFNQRWSDEPYVVRPLWGLSGGVTWSGPVTLIFSGGLMNLSSYDQQKISKMFLTGNFIVIETKSNWQCVIC